MLLFPEKLCLGASDRLAQQNNADAKGQPIRATVSEMGPLLLARMLELNDVQEGVLNIAFRAADDAKLLLLDLKDLRAVLAYVSEHADELQRQYGNVADTSIGAIQRQLLTLETQGAAQFFGAGVCGVNAGYFSSGRRSEYSAWSPLKSRGPSIT